MNIAPQSFDGRIRPHNAGSPAVWSGGGAAYDEVSRSKLDPERRERFKTDFVAFHERFADELGICVPRDYSVVHGTRH
ncbi:hypothetical protein [Thioalkalivibrio paradoxus]|uniref:Uncharacterized protein n=1 Tax=Thioalkalivibrio paradoxus ARh 1 TaxID=713585 RepID=W0DST4_9GAMM|nr:hypothetical protein [Thioalkalivibrio paradoxus]AHF00049.1 hypothetical protein THITH_07795 [Thioalkalivibrio paradoxus ARh 1]